MRNRFSLAALLRFSPLAVPGGGWRRDADAPPPSSRNLRHFIRDGELKRFL